MPDGKVRNSWRIVEKPPERTRDKQKVDGTDSNSCLMAGYHISNAESSSSVT
jgi:hypothetical protein